MQLRRTGYGVADKQKLKEKPSKPAQALSTSRDWQKTNGEYRKSSISGRLGAQGRPTTSCRNSFRAQDVFLQRSQRGLWANGEERRPSRSRKSCSLRAEKLLPSKTRGAAKKALRSSRIDGMKAGRFRAATSDGSSRPSKVRRDEVRRGSPRSERPRTRNSRSSERHRHSVPGKQLRSADMLYSGRRIQRHRHAISKAESGLKAPE